MRFFYGLGVKDRVRGEFMMKKKLLKRLQLGVVSLSALALLAACGTNEFEEPPVDEAPIEEPEEDPTGEEDPMDEEDENETGDPADEGEVDEEE